MRLYLEKILKDLAEECDMRERDKIAIFVKVVVKLMPKRITKKSGLQIDESAGEGEKTRI